MKIIDETPDPSVVKTIICRSCGVKIQYVPNDVKSLGSGMDLDGSLSGSDGFKCPNPPCGKNIVTRSW